VDRLRSVDDALCECSCPPIGRKLRKDRILHRSAAPDRLRKSVKPGRERFKENIGSNADTGRRSRKPGATQIANRPTMNFPRDSLAAPLIRPSRPRLPTYDLRRATPDPRGIAIFRYTKRLILSRFVSSRHAPPIPSAIFGHNRP
jgi:hypothetical protein